MNVILAGFNIDYETIKEAMASTPEKDAMTPETVSAAYARISRDPLSVDKLREISRREVEKARKSNRKIVFDMGHSSIAEHAVFNIDVIGVSRLITEEIEKFRLCSYTEKSQRYIRLEDDFVIPEEIRSCGLEGIFTYIVKAQNSFYHELYRDLEDYVFEKHQDMASNKANRSVLEGWAKEDARYIVSMATQTQLGMTINARNLELMLRRAAAHPLKEVNEYGTKLHNAVKDIAPSLVRYIKPTLFDSRTKSILREKILELLRRSGRYATKGRAVCESGGDVNLIYATPEGDEKILASLVHSSSGLAMKECEAVICEMSADEKEEILKTACIYMESYDPPSREFENADFIFEVTVSATCFAQLKRHRMATIVCQNYDPSLGVTVPSSIVSVGMEKRFMDMIRETEDVYGIVRSKSPEAAAYVLTNAHRKRVMVKVNARELYHISRLREDSHAQWDIRNIARQMVNLGKEEMPLSLFLTGGKDEFEALS